ncbi:MAG: LLM class flavin-dependent oxidoreductase [Acidimicrobiales bacterium]
MDPTLAVPNPDESPCRYGLILVGDAGPGWLDHVVAADDCGFWGLGVGDSQAIYPDVYVRLTQAAMVTTQLRLGPWVTNPLTRHPGVTAGAIASVDDVSGGRAFLGVGSGDSAAATIGERPATAAELADYVDTVDRLQRDGAASWRGRSVTHTPARRRVPIYLAASGPRAIRLAGRIADGVVIATGLTPEIVADARRELAVGASDAGRDPADIDVWWLALVNIAPDEDTALAELKGSLATFANMAVKAPALRARLDPGVADAMDELRRRYSSMHHARFRGSPNAELSDELGLTDYLRGRFALCGTPGTFAAEVRRAQAAGARNLWFSLRVPDKGRVLSMWRDEVRGLLAGA